MHNLRIQNHHLLIGWLISPTALWAISKDCPFFPVHRIIILSVNRKAFYESSFCWYFWIILYLSFISWYEYNDAYLRNLITQPNIFPEIPQRLFYKICACIHVSKPEKAKIWWGVKAEEWIRRCSGAVSVQGIDDQPVLLLSISLYWRYDICLCSFICS